MERIQEALAKARAERQRGSASRTDHAAPAASDGRVDADWQALTPITRDVELLKRNRVIAVESGHDAAPYDLLRTKIMYQAQTNGWRRIAIVSPDPAAGKSTTLANLAFSFERQRDMRVMCIDLDLRRPNMHKVLGQKPEHSMPDVLEGRVDFADHGMRLGERVAFGLNARPTARPSELLLSREAREGLDRIERAYTPDLVFFDISPLNVSDDNIAFLQNVDCALIIAAAEATATSHIDHAERQISELTNVMGIVLNKCRYASEIEGYNYQYY